MTHIGIFDLNLKYMQAHDHVQCHLLGTVLPVIREIGDNLRIAWFAYFLY